MYAASSGLRDIVMTLHAADSTAINAQTVKVCTPHTVLCCKQQAALGCTDNRGLGVTGWMDAVDSGSVSRAC